MRERGIPESLSRASDRHVPSNPLKYLTVEVSSTYKYSTESRGLFPKITHFTLDTVGKIRSNSITDHIENDVRQLMFT